MAEVDNSTQFEQGRKCKECGEKIPDDARKARVFCMRACQVNFNKRMRRERIGDEEFKRRNAEDMRKRRKNNPDYAERQRKAKDAWRVNNPEKLAEQRRRGNAYKSRYDAHVKHYKRHCRDMKRKHDAHVRSFYQWAKQQSAGWWMRHLKATGGDLWRNPKLSDAINYRIHYRLSVEFRLKEINRSTWRKEKLAARDDGTINFFALARERKTCVYCGLVMDENMKCLDHIDPLTKGGENSINNVIVVCKSCNSKKAAKDFEVFVYELPEHRRRAAMMMYKRKKGRLPGQQPLVLEFS